MPPCPICHHELDYHTDSACVAEMQARHDQLCSLVQAVLQQPIWREFISRDGTLVEVAVKMTGDQCKRLLQMTTPGIVYFPPSGNGGK